VGRSRSAEKRRAAAAPLTPQTSEARLVAKRSILIEALLIYELEPIGAELGRGVERAEVL
jgi:hypothetical protein